MVGWLVSLTTTENLTFPAEGTFSLQVTAAAAMNNITSVVHSKHSKDTEVAEKILMHTNQPTTTALGATLVVTVEVVLEVVDTEEEADMEEEEVVDTEEEEVVDTGVVDLEEVDLEAAVMATDMEDTSGQCM